MPPPYSQRERELQTQKQQLSETVALWSQTMLGFQAMDNTLSSEAHEALAEVSALANKHKSVAPMIQDRLSVLLAYTPLR
jgi:hypothetical protein